MKIQNITDVEKFFKVIDLSMATIFSNGYIKELDLVAHDKEDIERLIKYMYQGE